MVIGHSTHAQEPGWFTTAPVGAISKLFESTGWSAKHVDLYEINEAFAVVTMAAMKEHGLPHDKVNVHGGACALGHPIGASGARILVTLIGALRKYGLKRGVASLCIGGGEATAMAIELLLKQKRVATAARPVAVPAALRLPRGDSEQREMHARAAAQAGARASRRHHQRPGADGGGRLRDVARDQGAHRREDDALTSELNTAFLAPGQGRARLLHRAHPQDGPAPHLRRRPNATAKKGKLFSHHTRDLCPPG